MRTSALLFVAVLALAASAPAQLLLAPANGGNGSDGAFVPTANVTLDTTLQTVFQYTTLNIPAGVTVTCVGPTPIVIRVQGSATIAGILDASGQNGVPGNNNVPGGNGGAGGPGGGAGGIAGAHASNPYFGNGLPGLGASPGQPGLDNGPVPGTFTDPVGGGGGGGNATAGSPGGPPNAGPGPNISGAGGPAIAPCRAGSGGGGGGGDIDSLTTSSGNDGGGGGGGGGGQLSLYAGGAIIIAATGQIRANGGQGGISAGNGGGGGGGSGGDLELVAPAVQNDGSLSAQGGIGGLATQTNCGCSAGGAGGDGCIVIATGGYGGAGTSLPLATVVSHMVLTTPWAPVGQLQVVTPGPNDFFYVAAAFSLAPVPLPTPFGPFQLDFNDILLTWLFPVNFLPTIFSGLSGSGGGMVAVNTSAVGIPPGMDFTFYFQAASVAGTVLNGVSPVVPFRVKY